MNVEREVDTLMNLRRLFGLDHYQVLEIGPGNGDHTHALLGQIASSWMLPTAYLGVDFSLELLGLAKQKIAGLMGASVELKSWDIEISTTGQVERWRRELPLVALFLGNTLGNVAAPEQVLRNVRDSLRPGDVMLLGIAMHDENASDDEVVSPYRTEEFRAAVLEPLRAVGADPAHCSLSIQLRGRNVTAEVTLDRDFEARFSEYVPGGPVVCFQSNRYRHAEVIELLASTGWDVPEIASPYTAGYAAIPAVRS